MSLTQKQRQVLTAVYHATQDAGPQTEYRIYRAGREWGLWESGLLYGHLRKLTDKGLLEREGGRGSYRYSLTVSGRTVLTESSE